MGLPTLYRVENLIKTAFKYKAKNNLYANKGIFLKPYTN